MFETYFQSPCIFNTTIHLLIYINHHADRSILNEWINKFLQLSRAQLEICECNVIVGGLDVQSYISWLLPSNQLLVSFNLRYPSISSTTAREYITRIIIQDQAYFAWLFSCFLVKCLILSDLFWWNIYDVDLLSFWFISFMLQSSVREYPMCSSVIELLMYSLQNQISHRLSVMTW